jgi:NAD(P)-dependent dehydrogenase (short-subunit alcohol dehydrogenase family)
MDLRLKGKRALITGASRGIGKAIARQLGHEGVDCVICSRSVEALRATAEELAHETGRRFVPLVADTGKLESIQQLVRDAVKELGGLDILVNCAARVMKAESRETLETTSDEMVIQDFEEKFVGYLRCIREAVPHMLKSGGGRIINVSGSSARFGGFISSGARNAAVVNLSKSLSLELGPRGIYVNCILPGVTRTEAYEEKVRLQAQNKKIPVAEHEQQISNRRSLGRVVTADELANVAVFLASPCAIGLNGEALAVTGGEGNVVHY